LLNDNPVRLRKENDLLKQWQRYLTERHQSDLDSSRSMDESQAYSPINRLASKDSVRRTVWEERLIATRLIHKAA
jgi:hypothetical protein